MHRVKKKRRTHVMLRLQQEHHAALRQYRMLTVQNEMLRNREQFLLKAVQEQGDNLHYVALAAFQQEQQLLEACTCVNQQACTCRTGDAAAVTAKLLEDLKVYEMLQLVGGSAALGGAEEPNTTQWMRAAITPERVAEIRDASLEDIAAKLQSLTIRLSRLLFMRPSTLSLLSTTMEDLVFEYGEMGMLLHVAADRSNLKIGVLNLETLQRQEPPEGHWEYVLESLQLRPEQQQSLCTGFEQYLATSAPVIAEMQELGQRMQQLTGASAPTQGSAAAEDTPISSYLTDPDENPTASDSESSSGDSDMGEVQAGASAEDTGTSSSKQLLDVRHENEHLQLLPPPTAAAAAAAAGQQDATKLGRGNNNVVQGEMMQDAAAAMDWQQQQRISTQQERTQQQQQQQQTELPVLEPSLPEQQHHPQQQQGCLQFESMTSHLQTLEVYAELEETMKQLLNKVMKLRELHRTVTFLWLNTLDTRQQALSVVHSYPFWSRPLSMTRILAQQQGITDPAAGSGAAAAGRTATRTAAGAARKHGTTTGATTNPVAQPAAHQRKASAGLSQHRKS